MLLDTIYKLSHIWNPSLLKCQVIMDSNIERPQPAASISFNSESVVWIPCLPDYATGTLIPLYNLNNCPFPTTNPRDGPKISRGGIKSKPWTHQEDLKLNELVETHGLKQWSTIAKALNLLHENKKTRKGKHCRERWYNHLNPEINKGEWTYEEDILLLQQQKITGNKWSSISRLLKGRTENSVKNRWNSLIKNAKHDLNIQYMNNDSVANILVKELENCIAKKEEQ